MTDAPKHPAPTRPEIAHHRRGGAYLDGEPAMHAVAHAAPTLPTGYRLEREHETSSYYFLRWTSPSTGAEVGIAGPAKGKWQGQGAAIQAANHHAETHASDEAQTKVSTDG